MVMTKPATTTYKSRTFLVCAELARPYRVVKARKRGDGEYFVCLGQGLIPPTCTCDGFRYNRCVDPQFECFHIKEFRDEICTYTRGVAPSVKESHRPCPQCGKPLVRVEIVTEA